MLIELVRRAADQTPEKPVLTSAAGTLSYAECLARAERLARGLEMRGIDRFGIALDDPGGTVALLTAASAAGSEACVYPAELDGTAIAELASRFEHEVVVSAGELEELEDETGGDPMPAPEHAPVLILTTGTTGAQKGARHDWSRLLYAVRDPDRGSGARWLLAYGLNQFAGVQVLLHVLASGATMVAPRSTRAQDAIETMRETAVTHASATPTFWRLLAGGLDTESARALPLEQITLGGEPAPESLIRRLRELFPEARISHVYAGTEFGSVVSVRDGLAGLPMSVLERSDDSPAQLRIVDGELQIRSRVGMLGYHHGGKDDQEWRPTGDLVEEREGRIHFVGRTTEIINVGGAKVHPLPIEEVVCSVDGVELAAAYGRTNPVTGQIVAVDVVPAAGVDRSHLETEIKAACEALPRAGRPRRVRFVEELEVRGQKLVRQAEEPDG